MQQLTAPILSALSDITGSNMWPLPPDSLLQAYALANTPGYLYRALRESQYLDAFRAANQDNLLQFVERLQDANNNSATDIQAYAALIALALGGASSEAIFHAADRSQLIWGRDVAALALSNSINSTTSTFRVSHESFSESRIVSAAGLPVVSNNRVTP